MNKINKYINNIITIIRKPVMSVLPGQLSFFLLLSLIPMILVIGVICSISSVSTIGIIEFIQSSFPADTSKLLIPLLSGIGINYSTIVLIISALLLVSKGTRSIMRVASIIYDVEDKNTINEIIKSFIIAILLTLLISFIIIIPVLGSKLLNYLHNIKLLSYITDNLLILFNLLKWPISILIIYINLKIIYTISPNKKIPSSSVTIGTIFTTILWTLSTYLYSFYITNFSNYNTVYGGASSLIVLMLWVYLMSYIFTIGMSMNASYLKNKSDLHI